MIRVVIEQRAKDTEKLVNATYEIRNETMKQPGYVTGETLVHNEDPSRVIIISTWQSIEDFNAWHNSERMEELRGTIKDLLVEPIRVKIYRYAGVGQDKLWSHHRLN